MGLSLLSILFIFSHFSAGFIVPEDTLHSVVNNTSSATNNYSSFLEIMKGGKSALREPVGDFYVHLIRGNSGDNVDRELTSSNAILKGKGKPTVISFYDGG